MNKIEFKFKKCPYTETQQDHIDEAISHLAKVYGHNDPRVKELLDELYKCSDENEDVMQRLFSFWKEHLNKYLRVTMANKEDNFLRVRDFMPYKIIESNGTLWGIAAGLDLDAEDSDRLAVVHDTYYEMRRLFDGCTSIEVEEINLDTFMFSYRHQGLNVINKRKEKIIADKDINNL